MSPISRPVAGQSLLSLRGLVEVAALLLCAATVAGFGARLWWIFELFTHFRWHYLLGLAALTIFWLLKRRWRMSAACGLFAALNGVLVWQQAWPTEAPEITTGVSLRVVSLNVHTENLQHDAVLHFLESEDPDIIFLTEVNDAWMTALEPLHARYSHIISDPRDDNFGVALFSRLPLLQSETLQLGRAGVPSICATVSVGGGVILFLGTHPLPPGSAAYAALRNDQLREIAAFIRARHQRSIVVGDLNCTQFSPYFADLLRESGLRETSPSRGLFGTWPAPLAGARIALDHGLVSPSIKIIERRVGPNVGSDHLPLILHLNVPSAEVVRTNQGAAP